MSKITASSIQLFNLFIIAAESGNSMGIPPQKMVIPWALEVETMTLHELNWEQSPICRRRR